MKFYKLPLYIATVALVATSCDDDFLTKEDPNKIEQSSFFKDENDLLLYSNGFIEKMLPTADNIALGEDNHADYMVWNGVWTYLTDIYNADDQSGWTWTQLRNINYFLENLGRADVSDAVREHYEGVGRFWRAYFYYNKVKTFGAVPWYDQVINDNDVDLLYKPRDSREYVMSKILEDISYAADHCITNATLEKNAVQITKWVAQAMKARICLFEGTYRKYHATDPSTGKPWTKDESKLYLDECVKACDAIMGSKKYSLLNNKANVATQYRTLFNSENINAAEVMWSHPYSNALMSYNTLTYELVMHTVISANRRFMNTYLNLDGTPFTDRADYNSVEFIDEFKNRDWRMSQTFRHPGFTRLNNGKPVASPPTFAYAATGYHIIKWTIDDTSLDNTKSPGYNSTPIIRFAEILLNYAEAKYELGEFSDDVWNSTIKLLRERAGVKGDKPTAADPYMVNYFLGEITDPILLEIRRERGVELFMEDTRWDDLMRWSMGKLTTIPWEGIYVPYMETPFDLDGDGTLDVAFVKKTPAAANQVKGVQYRVVNNDFALSEGTKGNLQIYHGNVRVWEDYKYVRPIPTNDVHENPALGQNPGWEK